MLALIRLVAAGCAVLALATVPAAAQSAKALLKDAQGKVVGNATLTQTPNGVLVRLSIMGLPAGERAFHIHAVGRCEPPFTSAEGHFNPGGKQHGFLSAAGAHAGDMPNLHVPASGALEVEVLNRLVTLDKGAANSLLGPSGTSLIIHAGKDDYKSDPAGDAGGRIACGVIEAQ